jgi:hypothetical protein
MRKCSFPKVSEFLRVGSPFILFGHRLNRVGTLFHPTSFNLLLPGFNIMRFF